MSSHSWTPKEEEIASDMRSRGATYDQIGARLGLTAEQVRWRSRQNGLSFAKQRIRPSPCPVYDKPLRLEGNALVLPDIELPYHDSDFLNAVVDLAVRSGIENCVCAGDMLHFHSLSLYDPNWEIESPNIEDERIQLLIDAVPDELRATLIDVIDRMAPAGESSITGELNVARAAVASIGQSFKTIHYVLGNHEGRFLRSINSPMSPDEILRILEAGPNWMIAPFYYSIIESGGRTFQVEHPKSASPCTAKKLAVKYQCSTLVAHSHRVSLEFDPSGTHYAVTMGCCVDERRLPYAAQRHHNADAHRLGAVIVKDGYPYLLFEGCQLLDGERVI